MVLLYKTQDESKKYVSAGVPQGSFLGAILRLTHLALKTVGFTDDIAVVAVAKYLPDFLLVITECLMLVGLILADKKTEATLITT